MDTEGFDFEILKMFDLKRNKPKVVVFEHIHLSEKDQKECMELLTETGYLSRKSGVNTLAVLKPVSPEYMSILESIC